MITIPIKSKIVTPKLKCEKMIFLKSQNMSVIKLYLKNLKRQDFRITLKNVYDNPYTIEPSILKNEIFSKSMDFTFFPSSANVNAQTQANFILSIKTTFKENEANSKEMNCVLVAKVKNSSIFFAYPVIILIGDGRSSEIAN